MKQKRITIDQAMCDHAKLLLAGGAKAEQAAELLGVGESTIYRMKKAEYNAEKYNENKIKERMPKMPAGEKQAEDEMELPGQIRMEIRPVQETAEDQTKAMRFQAAMVDRLIVELDKINDTLSKFIRATSGL